MTTDELQCYNKGCLQKFRESDNHEKACTYHAGEPVFHDVYKYWSCCKKRTTDFTVFLETKGCTIGCHNPDKPPEPVKTETEVVDDRNTITVKAPKPAECAPRLAQNHPKKRLPIQIAQSLNSHLTQKSNPQEENDRMKNGDESNNEIPAGTRCKHAGCTKEYVKGMNSNDEVCWYHSGTAIFHEGMKYWSCCQRKTSDFETFLQQTGCTSGTHLWKKEESSSDAQTIVTDCRYDWHQTGNDVYVTIYAKWTQPVDSYVEVNAVNLTAHIEFEDGRSVFDLEIPLWGAIDVANSLVTMTAAKVEVKMKKKDNVSWPRINYS